MKKRAPYSFVKIMDGPIVANYLPKFSHLDPNVTMTHVDARLGDAVDKRQFFKPIPTCVTIARNYCNLDSRK